nr:hypothetical protein [Vibrio splendidus]MCC4882497.1 hypothetical protein [Vibrio splendidus]
MITTVAKNNHLKVHSVTLSNGKVLSVEADTEVTGNQQVETALTLILDGYEFADIDLSVLLNARSQTQDSFEATKPKLKIVHGNGVEGFDKSVSKSARLSSEARAQMLSVSVNLYGALNKDKDFLLNHCRNSFNETKFSKPLEREFNEFVSEYLINSIEQAA